jgi:hypothetical protein
MDWTTQSGLRWQVNSFPLTFLLLLRMQQPGIKASREAGIFEQTKLAFVFLRILQRGSDVRGCGLHTNMVYTQEIDDDTYKVHPHYDAINVCKLKLGAATSPYLPLSVGFQRCGIHTIPTNHRCVL